MSRARLLTVAALLALAAYVGLRAVLRPEPYVTLARPGVAPPATAAAAAAAPANAATGVAGVTAAPAPPGAAEPGRPPPGAAEPGRPPPGAAEPGRLPPGGTGAAAEPGPAGHPPLAAEPGAAGSRRDPPTAAALRALLAALDRARAAGYADPVAADPDSWAARSCGCHAVDTARLRALAGSGRALRGHRAVLLRVAVARAGPASAELLVTDRLGPYAAVDRRGRVVARWAAPGPRRWRVVLVRGATGRWLLGTVARAP